MTSSIWELPHIGVDNLMDKFEKFTSYNQITKEFDVLVMNKTQINQLDNNKRFLVLDPKKTKPVLIKTNPKSKQPSLRQLILDMSARLDRLEQMVIQDHNLLIKLIKLNNLRTE